MATHVVKALQLNLRSAASPTAPRVAVLPQGTEVTKVADASRPDWFEVDTSVHGVAARGFVNSTFLAPIGTSFPIVTPVGGVIPPADMGKSSSAKRTSRSGLAFGIGEPGVPKKAITNPGGLAQGILAVLDFLDVGDTSHERWQPTSAATFCNVYTYDVCNIAGVYLPRVWWKPAALAKLRAGQPVDSNTTSRCSRYGPTSCSIGSGTSARDSDGNAWSTSTTCRPRSTEARSASSMLSEPT
jgi:hypothetical protein